MNENNDYIEQMIKKLQETKTNAEFLESLDSLMSGKRKNSAS